MFRKMPFIILAILLFMGLANPWIPLTFKASLYALSLSLKSVIVFVLPFLVFSMLFKTAASMAKKASKWILFILSSICVSNFISTMICYPVGSLAYHLDLSMVFPNGVATLLPTWDIALPKLIGNDYAMFLGLGLGVFCGMLRPALASSLSLVLEKIVAVILKSFLYIIPLFITGFMVKMMHEGVLMLMLKSYALIFAIVAVSVFSYIALIYGIGNRFNLKGVLSSLKNMLPAAITGFGSMSSSAAMPLTILATEKNSKNPDMARSFIPATVNVHLIGDCFAIPIFAFAIMKTFGVAEPSFLNYLLFASYFVLAKFSVAAVPGGGILVMIPILEKYLGFNAEMLSAITALYILFDPLITSANVLGNGGFALTLGRLFSPSEVKRV